MNTEELASLVLQSFAGELSPSDRIQLDQALAADAALKVEIESLHAIWRDLGQLPAPQPSPALRAQFYQKLNAYPKKRLSRDSQVRSALVEKNTSTSGRRGSGFVSARYWGRPI